MCTEEQRDEMSVTYYSYVLNTDNEKEKLYLTRHYVNWDHTWIINVSWCKFVWFGTTSLKQRVASANWHDIDPHFRLLHYPLQIIPSGLLQFRSKYWKRILAKFHRSPWTRGRGLVSSVHIHSATQDEKDNLHAYPKWDSKSRYLCPSCRWQCVP
jgi:hypothetical protein